MTSHSLAAIQDILRLEPSHDPLRQELERIIIRARLTEADTDVPGGPITRRDAPHHTCRGLRVVFESAQERDSFTSVPGGSTTDAPLGF